jgi:hypothetical protein
MSDTTNYDLNFNSENRTNELADGQLDERALEAINGGVGQPDQKISVSSLIDVVQAPIQAPIPYGRKGIGGGRRVKHL